MSEKNLTESLSDAWRQSIENGSEISDKNQKEDQQVNDIIDNTRNNILDHLQENDKGFYRPETNYYFNIKDGGALKRQRLMEKDFLSKRLEDPFWTKSPHPNMSDAEYNKLIAPETLAQKFEQSRYLPNIAGGLNVYGLVDDLQSKYDL